MNIDGNLDAAIEYLMYVQIYPVFLLKAFTGKSKSSQFIKINFIIRNFKIMEKEEEILEAFTEAFILGCCF